MLRLGIIGCSDIAYRRFMPAVECMDEVEVKAVAEEYAPQKLEQFCGTYSLEGETSFEKLLDRKDIDAVYSTILLSRKKRKHLFIRQVTME